MWQRQHSPCTCRRCGMHLLVEIIAVPSWHEYERCSVGPHRHGYE